MKSVKIFALTEEAAINDFLKENKDNMLDSSINIFSDKIVFLIESDKRLRDQIINLESQRVNSQNQKNAATLSIAAIDNELAIANSTATEVGSEESKALANKITELNGKKEDYESVIAAQNFYLAEMDKLTASLKV